MSFLRSLALEKKSSANNLIYLNLKMIGLLKTTKEDSSIVFDSAKTHISARLIKQDNSTRYAKLVIVSTSLGTNKSHLNK